MMRLQRVGRKNEPSYRIVVVDKRTGPKSNKNIDQLGFYNPKLGVFEIDGEKAKDWLSKGVQASDTVHNMLVSKKVIDAKKINVLPKMKNRKVAEPVAEEAAPTEEAPKEETPAEEKSAEVTA